MLRVPLKSAQPGMKLALPIMNPERPEQALLRQDYVLDARSIDRLIQLSLDNVWIHYPSLDFLARHFSQHVASVRSEMTSRISGVFAEFAREKYAVLDYAGLGDAVASLIDALVEEPASALLMDQFGVGCSESTRHSTNVAFLSILMGLKLGDYIMSERARVSGWRARDFGALGLGAMLHDIGMTRVNEDDLESWRRTGEMSDAVAHHVNAGFGLVRGKIKPSAAAVVLHHHQRYNGSGFPKKQLLDGTERALFGDEIHIFARIVGLADEFDRRLTGSDGVRERAGGDRPRVQVLHELLAMDEHRDFDPMVLRSLLNVCPPYPPGSIVGLSTGMDAVVVTWNPLNPCRPVVQRIDRDQPDREFDERLDLCDHPDARIIRADECDVEAFHFEPESESDFDLRAAGVRQSSIRDEMQRSA